MGPTHNTKAIYFTQSTDLNVNLIQKHPCRNTQNVWSTIWASPDLLSHSVLPNSLRPHGLQPARLLCPWDSPCKNTGVGCHFLLQGIFPTQGSNPHLLHWQEDSSALSHLRSPILHFTSAKIDCSGIMCYIFSNSNTLSTWWLFVIIKYTQIFLPSKWYIMFSVCLFMLIHTNHWLWNVGHNLTNWAKVIWVFRLLLADISVYQEIIWNWQLH